MRFKPEAKGSMCFQDWHACAPGSFGIQSLEQCVFIYDCFSYLQKDLVMILWAYFKEANAKMLFISFSL